MQVLLHTWNTMIRGIDMACLMFGNMIHMVTQAQVCNSEFLTQQQAGWALPLLALSVGSMLCIANKGLTVYQVKSCKQRESG